MQRSTRAVGGGGAAGKRQGSSAAGRHAGCPPHYESLQGLPAGLLGSREGRRAQSLVDSLPGPVPNSVQRPRVVLRTCQQTDEQGECEQSKQSCSSSLPRRVAARRGRSAALVGPLPVAVNIPLAVNILFQAYVKSKAVCGEAHWAAHWAADRCRRYRARVAATRRRAFLIASRAVFRICHSTRLFGASWEPAGIA